MCRHSAFGFAEDRLDRALHPERPLERLFRPDDVLAGVGPRRSVLLVEAPEVVVGVVGVAPPMIDDLLHVLSNGPRGSSKGVGRAADSRLVAAEILGEVDDPVD
ncbi:hypothetical protein ASG06_04000 [Rathayibacter sp. Leaf185]|nr:hypothetical protein ASF42_03990 [Rathayibacter sp. Leaf294]KQS13592.1 hypothetical protein ASG06_04000 [Rathayibacter sp. Leaf185]